MKKRPLVYVLPALLGFALACGGSKSGASSGPTGSPQGEIPTSQVPADIYMTQENPGRWKEQANDHQVIVRDIRVYKEGKKRMRELAVTVPLQGTGQHYLEAGLILDNSLKKELAKVAFKPGTPVYEFKLSIPAENPYAVYVVVKCNQHDMWLKRVEPLPKPDEE